MMTRSYLQQTVTWPTAGRHILARYDTDSVYIYQAYRASIARYAVEHQRFGGDDFSYSRMSWIKPNFLWMMYRCGWASKAGQERVLSVRLRRSFFDEMLQFAVASSFDARLYSSRDEWREAVAASEVRLQWDPDHDPAGRPLQRRALQLGLRGRILRRYGEEEILTVEDITTFVKDQAQTLERGLDELMLPDERVYEPSLAAALAAVWIPPPVHEG
jgi:hypothetical protein